MSDRSRRLLREMSAKSVPCEICKLYDRTEKTAASTKNATPTLQIARGDTGCSTLPSNCRSLWLGRLEESRNISSGAISRIFFFPLPNNRIIRLLYSVRKQRPIKVSSEQGSEILNLY